MAEIHVAIFIDVHTLRRSNLFALSDTPNIVTRDTTPRPLSRGPAAPRATQEARSQRRRHEEAKVKLSVKGSERKSLSQVRAISRSFRRANVYIRQTPIGVPRVRKRGVF